MDKEALNLAIFNSARYMGVYHAELDKLLVKMVELEAKIAWLNEALNSEIAECVRLRKIEEAARTWWLSKRPKGWTEELHLYRPTVNMTTGSEVSLALAVSGGPKWN